MLDEKGEILRCNSATADALGYSKKEILGKELKNFLLNGNYDEDVLSRLTEIKEVYNIDTSLRTKSGEIRQVLLSTRIAEDKRKEFLGIIVSVNDVTEILKIQKELEDSREKYKQMADELYRSSYYDHLTQLPNRRKLYEELTKLKEEYDCKQKGLALIYMDLDGFKKVNDTYGHEVGDLVIVETARKLEDIVGADGFIARMGGDEFVCILSDADIEKQVWTVMHRIHERFGDETDVKGRTCRVGISIGYSIYSGEQNLDDLIRNADQAMYSQKQGKRLACQNMVRQSRRRDCMRGGAYGNQGEAGQSMDEGVYSEGGCICISGYNCLDDSMQPEGYSLCGEGIGD